MKVSDCEPAVSDAAFANPAGRLARGSLDCLLACVVVLSFMDLDALDNLTPPTHDHKGVAESRDDEDSEKQCYDAGSHAIECAQSYR